MINIIKKCTFYVDVTVRYSSFITNIVFSCRCNKWLYNYPNDKQQLINLYLRIYCFKDILLERLLNCL